MATASTDTLMSLDTFAKIIGVHPLHFNQVQFQGVTGGCGKVWLQYDWQGPTSVSRESVARAIQSAEQLLEEFLGFPTRPKWFTDVILPMQYSPLVIPVAHYITGGRETHTLLQSGAAIVYSDADMDGYKETATISVVTSVVDPSEIAVFYPSDDRQIPIKKIVINGGTATITIGREDLVKRDLLEALHPTAIYGTEDSSFIDTVDVYRIWGDPSTQCYLRHRQVECCSLATGCEKCVFDEHIGCLVAKDHKSSIVAVSRADWNTDHFQSVPLCDHKMYYAARTSFKAGWTGDPIWDQAIAYLALTQLDAGLCECPSVQQRLAYWTTDLSKSDKVASYKVPRNVAQWQCPWGYQRGALFAYSIAHKHSMPQGQI